MLKNLLVSFQIRLVSLTVFLNKANLNLSALPSLSSPITAVTGCHAAGARYITEMSF